MLGTRGAVSVGLGEQGLERLHLIKTQDAPSGNDSQSPNGGRACRSRFATFFFFLERGMEDVSRTCCVHKHVIQNF